MANQIFADKHFPLDNAYVKESLEFYDTPVKSYNFGSDGKYFQDQVNQWVRVKTRVRVDIVMQILSLQKFWRLKFIILWV